MIALSHKFKTTTIWCHSIRKSRRSYVREGIIGEKTPSLEYNEILKNNEGEG